MKKNLVATKLLSNTFEGRVIVFREAWRDFKWELFNIIEDLLIALHILPKL